jgi:hypothetical protein
VRVCSGGEAGYSPACLEHTVDKLEFKAEPFIRRGIRSTRPLKSFPSFEKLRGGKPTGTNHHDPLVGQNQGGQGSTVTRAGARSRVWPCHQSC